MQGDEGPDETKFDAFLGNDAGVLGQTGIYDEEDREADEVWDHIEDRMDERRKVGGWPGGPGAGPACRAARSAVGVAWRAQQVRRGGAGAAGGAPRGGARAGAGSSPWGRGAGGAPGYPQPQLHAACRAADHPLPAARGPHWRRRSGRPS